MEPDDDESPLPEGEEGGVPYDPIFKVGQDQEIRGLQGTCIVLEGIPKSIIRKSSLYAGPGKRGRSPLATEFSKVFRRAIREKGVEIWIERRKPGRRTEREYVAPMEFKGPKFTDIMELDAGSKGGRVQLDLYMKVGQKSLEETVNIHRGSAVIEPDITRLKGFDGQPWTQLAGMIVVTNVVKRSGNSVSESHGSWLAVASALHKREPQLKAFIEQHTTKTLVDAEVRALKKALSETFGKCRLSEVKLPETQAALAGGIKKVAVRSNLGRTTGPIKKRDGRLPYVRPPLSSSEPEQQPPEEMGTTTVEGLQWFLRPFSEEERDLRYKLAGGAIDINTLHPDYQYFLTLAPDSSAKSRRRQKLIWMAMITCIVIVDINLPADEHKQEDRNILYGIWLADVTSKL